MAAHVVGDTPSLYPIPSAPSAPRFSRLWLSTHHCFFDRSNTGAMDSSRPFMILYNNDTNMQGGDKSRDTRTPKSRVDSTRGKV